MIRRTDLTVNELVEILNANPTGRNQYTGKGGGSEWEAQGKRSGVVRKARAAYQKKFGMTAKARSKTLAATKAIKARLKEFRESGQKSSVPMIH